MNLLQKALKFSTVAHHGQVRKYTGEPYVNHCIDVVEILKRHKITREDILCAAMLHDTVEDTDVTFQDIEKEFGEDVMRMVFFVTDVVEKSHGDRQTINLLNGLHVAGTTDKGSLLIKCADIISNTSTIMQRDPDFAPLYLSEKKKLLNRMWFLNRNLGDEKIWLEAVETVMKGA